jgi:ribosomal protein L40E
MRPETESGVVGSGGRVPSEELTWRMLMCQVCCYARLVFAARSCQIVVPRCKFGLLRGQNVAFLSNKKYAGPMVVGKAEKQPLC